MKRRSLSLLAVVSLLVGLMPLAASSATSGNVVDVTVNAPATPVFEPVNSGQSAHHPHGRGTCEGWDFLNNYNLHGDPGISQHGIRITGPGGDPEYIEAIAPGASDSLADDTAATSRSFQWAANSVPGGPGGGGLVNFTLTRDLSECHGLDGDYESYEALFSSETGAEGDLVVVAPVDACAALTNAGAVAGNIALVQTGTCTAAVAYSNALTAGATGVIFYDPSGLKVFLGGAPSPATIPAVMVDQLPGVDFAFVLAGGYTVNVTIGDEPTDTVSGPTWSDELGVSAVTQTSLTLEWPAATPGGSAVVGYRVYQDGDLLDTVGSSTLSLDIIDLEPGEEYEFSVIADDSLGLESEALTGEFETDSLTAPYWPEDASLEAETDQTFLTLEWPAALDDDGTVVEYQIFQDGDETPTYTVPHVDEQETFELLVEELTPNETYDFEVVAVDSDDLVSDALTGTFGTDPLTPPYWVDGELLLSNITVDSVQLAWDPAEDDDGEVVEYRIEVDGVAVAWLDETNWNYTVTELEPGTLYEFAVVAVDDDDLEASLTNSATTLIAPAWPDEAALTAPTIGQTSLTLSWPAAIDDDNGLEGYRIYRGTDEIGDVPAGTTTLPVGGLTANTLYTFSVVAYDTDGLETEPLVGNFTTAPLTGPFWGVDDELTVANLTETTADLSWPAASDADGEVVGYRVEANGEVQTTVDAGILSYQVTDLTPGVSYDFSVFAIDDDDLEASLGATASTLIAPIWPVDAELVASDITETTITLTWPEAIDPDDGLAEYELFLGDVAVFGTLVSPGPTSHVVTELEPGESYTFRVYAIDADNLRSVAMETTVSTLIAPTWPDDAELTATEVGLSSLTLNWTAAVDADNGLAGYRVYQDGDLLDTVDASTTSYEVDGLEPDTDYAFSVVAFDEDGLETEPLEADIATGSWVQTTVGAFDPLTGEWHLRDEAGNVHSFFFGVPGDIPIVGDWDCDGVDTVGLYRQSDGYAYIRNTNDTGVAHRSFFFGEPGDIPLAGDFDGDGCDTVGVYRPSEGRVFISNTLPPDGGALSADFSYWFGVPGDKPFVGDFDGDGEDTIGLHRESTGLVYFRDRHSQGEAENEFYFGNPGDRLVAGDWGLVDGVDTPAVFRPGEQTWYFRHSNTQGNADSQLVWGNQRWQPVAGKFGLD